MNEAEKERLIKKDIESIENKVRHAFNQGYEMGMKERQNTCGDAISRQEIISTIYDRKSDFKNDFAQGFFADKIRDLPSVTPAEKVGQWEYVRYEGFCGNWHCSECRTIIPHMPEEKDNTPIYKWCPMCGAKMEVEDAD